MRQRSIITPAGNRHGTSEDRDVDWRQDAACHPDRYQGYPDDFDVQMNPINGRGGKRTLSQSSLSALDACHTCPVLAQCRADMKKRGDLARGLIRGGVAKDDRGRVVAWTVKP